MVARFNQPIPCVCHEHRPECTCLSESERFDLSKQIRIRDRNKRIAMRLGDQRVKRQRVAACWGVALAIAAIMIVLSLSMSVVPRLVEYIR